MAIDLARYYALLKEATLVRVRGRVTELTGLVIKASVPNVRVGELVLIKSRARGAVKAEVVGFQGDEVMLMPLGELYGHRPGQRGDPHRQAAHHQVRRGAAGPRARTAWASPSTASRCRTA